MKREPTEGGGRVEEIREKINLPQILFSQPKPEAT